MKFKKESPDSMVDKLLKLLDGITTKTMKATGLLKVLSENHGV